MTKFWGHCKNCRHFGSHAALPLDSEEAVCNHPSLAPFELSVFGAGGCNAFEVRSGLPSGIEEAPRKVELA